MLPITCLCHPYLKRCMLQASSMKVFSTTSAVPARKGLDHRYVIDRPGVHKYYMKRDIRPDIYTINKRQKQVVVDQKIRYGKELIARRSDFLDWNYGAELSAFQARIGERFDDVKLRQAFVTPDYLESERLKERGLGINKNLTKTSAKTEDDELETVQEEGEGPLLTHKDLEMIRESSNFPMAMKGRGILESTLKAYVRAALPYLPEEGVAAVVEFLTDDKTLAHASFHIGTKDLVLSKEYPPSKKTLADALRALFAALWESGANGQERTKRLVIDIVGTQLHGKDINDIWNVDNPMGVVTKLLANQGLAEPESRLLWVSGETTIMACYHVGIYCDKELIGKAPGESAEIAEEMAARDVLRNMFGYQDAAKPLPFTKELTSSKTNELVLQMSENAGLSDWNPQNVIVTTV